jgi:integrase
VAEVSIPEHQSLSAELETGAKQRSLVVALSGAVFGLRELSRWFADAIAEGLPDACKMHGLRKTPARMLAKAGCTAHAIMAVTGHKSLKEVERCTRTAAKKGLGRSAVHKLGRNVNVTSSGKRAVRQSGKHDPEA